MSELSDKIEWYKERPEIEGLTKNQRQIIDDRYKKDDVSYSAWIGRVSRNIALAELVYKPEFRDRILDGVSYDTLVGEEIDGYKRGEALLLHSDFGLGNYREMGNNFGTYKENLYKLRQEDENARNLVDEVEEQYYDMISNFRFVPNTPTMLNAGRKLQQLSACYVLPIEDSIESWGIANTHTMLIHKSGGGTGFSGARIRPSGDKVKGSYGIASGPLSVLEIIDKSTNEVKQGGARRGANMGILPYNHPDIKTFITYKKDNPGHLKNFNVSVAISEEFMGAMENGTSYPLINPRTGGVHLDNEGNPVFQNAKELWDLMIKYAHATGDPGFVVLDRINKSTSNPTPEMGEIEATNPCGEQPLYPYEPCNLGSVNLSAHTSFEEGLNFNSLEKTIRTATRFLDNVIDMNNYPVSEIEAIAKRNKRIGLGIMGLAETLAKEGIAYDSDEGVEYTRKVMKFVNDISHDASEKLAEERGLFPNFKDSIFDENGKNYSSSLVEKGYKPRNCAITTIAPTGTIALIAGLEGQGIEPFFAISYERFTADGLDAEKKGETPLERDKYYIFNRIFEEVAQKNNYFGMSKKELGKKIAQQGGSVRHIEEIPEDIRRSFPSAHEVDVKYHVEHQAASQQHTDNAVSKTINFSNESTIEDVADAYMMAYKKNCKGLTIYRDGSKDQQVLNLESKVDNLSRLVHIDVEGTHPRLEVSDNTGHYRVKRDEKNMDSLHIIISDELYKDGKGNAYFLPRRDFQIRAPPGEETTIDFGMNGLLMTEIFKTNPNYAKMITWMKSAKSDEEEGLGPSKLWTKHHAVAIALERHLLGNGVIGYDSSGKLYNVVRKSELTKVDDEEKREILKNKNGNNGSTEQNITGNTLSGERFVCKICGGTKSVYEGGCHEPGCGSCGWRPDGCG